MDVWSKSAFILVAAGLLTGGLRNIRWSVAKEELRFRKLISRGLSEALYVNGVMNFLLGGLLVFAARSIPHTVSWQLLGLLIVINGCIAIVVGRSDATKTLTLEQMPDKTTLLKRVKYRRVSGILLSLGAVAWLLNGLPNAI